MSASTVEFQGRERSQFLSFYDSKLVLVDFGPEGIIARTLEITMKGLSSKRGSTLVTIGLPVCDETVLGSPSMHSLLDQSHSNLEIVIPGSTSLCNSRSGVTPLLHSDPRFQIVESPRVLGPAESFFFVLQQARGSFFMWASPDDLWDRNYVSANLAALNHDSRAICSVSRVEFVDDDRCAISMDAGTQSLLGSPRDNIATYLRKPGANSRFFGLFRTEVLKESFHETDTFWAGDWAIMARTLTWGKHLELSECLLRRSIRRLHCDMSVALPEFNRNWLTRRFPMLPLSWTLLTDPSLPFSWGLFRALWRWNLRYRRHTLGIESGRAIRPRFAYPALQRIGARRQAA